MIGGFHEGLSPVKRTVILDFPFPLRDCEIKGDRKVMAHLWLPRDLTRKEADKLHQYMLAMVIE